VTRIVDRIAARAVRAGVGLSVAVESHGRLYARGYGLAGVRPVRLVTPATVFPVASLTKQFTAAAIMQLVQRHRLRLQDTVGGLLPGIRWADPRARRVTVRELLTHTSGIPGYTSVPAFARLESQPQSSRTILRLVSGLPLKFAPGTGAAYSNTGYYLLGLLIQRVTGLPYGQYLQQRLLAGLGLTHTGLCPEPATGDEASLYRTGGRSPAAAPRISLVNAYAAGELCSTATDLLRWQAALRSGRVVALAAYRQMVTPLRLADGRTIAYGFGLDLDPIDGHPAVSHEGGFPGATSELVWFPHDDLAIAVLSNSSAVAAWDLSAQIAAPLLRNSRPTPA
jgi:CubicO group peptidase (beta-lactamase class C family)